MTRKLPLKWMSAVFLALFHGLAIAAFFQPFSAAYLPIMVGLYLWMGFGTTFYLHRLLTHRAFETTGFIKFFFFLGNAIGQQGDPVGWVGHHRWHHAKSDQEEDFHSPRHGFFHSHMGWILRDLGPEEEKRRALARDIREKYPYARLAENPVFFFMPHLAVGVALYATLGLPGLLWGLYVPMVAVYHVTWSVNSLCHMVGYRTTETGDRSRNFWPIGLLALGEGWHNNHHACQTRAPQGLAWYEIDLTKYLIWALSKVGLVWNVRWTAPIRKADPVPPATETRLPNAS